MVEREQAGARPAWAHLHARVSLSLQERNRLGSKGSRTPEEGDLWVKQGKGKALTVRAALSCESSLSMGPSQADDALRMDNILTTFSVA